jgi:hypothetical protein
LPPRRYLKSAAPQQTGKLISAVRLLGYPLWMPPGCERIARVCDKLFANMSRKRWRDWVSPGIGCPATCPEPPTLVDDAPGATG